MENTKNKVSHLNYTNILSDLILYIEEFFFYQSKIPLVSNELQFILN